MDGSEGQGEDLSEIQQRLREDVAQFGWHVLLIVGDEEGPGFAYSVGLQHSYGHPEIIMFGLRHETMHAIINLIGERVKAGACFTPDQVSDEFLQGYDVVFRRVDSRWHEEYFGQAIDFYEETGFTALQCVWPDCQGRFPWQPDFDPGLLERQPLLG